MNSEMAYFVSFCENFSRNKIARQVARECLNHSLKNYVPINRLTSKPA